MNTTSLLLTGRPASASAITVLPSPSPQTRPTPLRQKSTTSTGWYLDTDTPSLSDFERRAQTYAKRLERFLARCVKDAVMGLMSPAAVVLVVFNPVLLVVLLVFLVVVFG